MVSLPHENADLMQLVFWSTSVLFSVFIFLGILNFFGWLPLLRLTAVGEETL